MRYLGGLLGGSWTTAFLSDLGAGRFDGANLVANFESLDPANTYWRKPYNVHSKIDTEPARFLEFETWWGSPVLLEAEEIRYIVDELFIGDKLSASELSDGDAVRIDLRNINSPVIVFCSHGDNITPPQQALGWIRDLYTSTDDIVAAGQTIIYSLNQNVGHLAIFVSSRVAKKEHAELVQNMDLIDVLPPGLYEAVVSEIDPQTPYRELISGGHFLRFAPRTLDDIDALGWNDAEDDCRFEAAARVSDIGESLYKTLVHPTMKALVTEQSAAVLRQLHPCRLRFSIFSDQNPFMAPIARLAAEAREHRRRADEHNPFVAIEKTVSKQIVAALDAYRDARDQLVEWLFMGVYGSTATRAATGMDGGATAREPVGRDLLRELWRLKADADVDAKVEEGGLVEAVVRGLLYVAHGPGRSGTDERILAMLRQIRAELPESRRVGVEGIKRLVREQRQILLLDEERAIAAIPTMAARANAKERAAAAPAIRHAASVAGGLSADAAARLSRIEELFAEKAATSPPRSAEPGTAPARGKSNGGQWKSDLEDVHS
jgi:hypothetical protein